MGKCGSSYPHERLQRGTSPQRAPLERHALQLHHDAKRRLPLPERALRDDGARGRGQASPARLQPRRRELRRAPRVLQHQDPGRRAHLAAPAHRARPARPRRAQAHRHAARREPQARQAPLPARHGDGPRALHEHHPGPGDVRAVRVRRPRARRPARERFSRTARSSSRSSRATSSSATRSASSSSTTRRSRANRTGTRGASRTSSRRASSRRTWPCRPSTPSTIASCSAEAPAC